MKYESELLLFNQTSATLVEKGSTYPASIDDHSRHQRSTAGPPPGTETSSFVTVLAFVAILTTVSAVPVWMCDYFPTHNGPSLLNVAYMQSEFENPRLGYSEFFDMHPFPVPYLLQTAFLNLLFIFVSPIAANKIWITFLILLRPAALSYFLRRLQSGREIYALACIPLLFDFSMMRGYANFHAGVSIGFIVFGYFLSHRHRWCVKSTAVLNLLVLMQYFTHPVALAVTGLLLAAYELAATRSVWNIVAIVLRGYLPSIALLAGFMWWSSEYGAWVQSHFDFNSLSDKVQNLHFRGATPLSTAANLLSLALLTAIGIGGLTVLFRKHGRAACFTPSGMLNLLKSEPILASVATAWILYLLMPWSMTGWHKADVRLIPIGFMLVLAIPPAIESAGLRTAFLATTTLASLACTVLIWPELERRNDDVVEFCAGISATPERSKILSLFEREERDEQWRLEYAFNHLQRTANYYTLVRGGATTSSLAENNTLYWIWFKDYRNMAGFPDVDTRDPEPDQIVAAAEAYDAILLWGDLNEIRDQFAALGFDESFRQGRLTVLANADSTTTLARR